MAYTSSSAADRLAAVRQAIDNCLSSQAYSIRGRSQQAAQLASLAKLEERLMEEVQQESNSGRMCSLGVFTPPT